MLPELLFEFVPAARGGELKSATIVNAELTNVLPTVLDRVGLGVIAGIDRALVGLTRAAASSATLGLRLVRVRLIDRVASSVLITARHRRLVDRTQSVQDRVTSVTVQSRDRDEASRLLSVARVVVVAGGYDNQIRWTE